MTAADGRTEDLPEDLRYVHDLLDIPQDSERTIHDVLGERYREREPHDPEVRLDLDYVILWRTLQWGAAAAATGVIGNAVYDAAKSALRSFARRRRRDRRASLSPDEARAFSLYALAHLVNRGQQESRVWRDHEPPTLTTATTDGDHWICRFEETWDTTYQGSPATWAEMIDIRIDGSAPDLSDTQYRTGTDLRTAPAPDARQHGRIRQINFGAGLDERGPGERRETDWTPVTGPTRTTTPGWH